MVRGWGAACSGGFGECRGGLEVVTGEGELWCGRSGGILVALWLEVAVGTPPTWGVTMGGCLFGRDLLGDCASAACKSGGVHVFLQGALCSLWGHSGVVA